MLALNNLYAQNGVFGLLILGIVYQNNFKNRKDWISLSHLFSDERLTTEFRRSARISGSEMRVSVSSNVDHRIYNFLGAVGGSRLRRKVDGDHIIFFQPSGNFDVDNFYVYPYEIDHGHYKHLPPCVGRVLDVLVDYFELQPYETSFHNRKAFLFNSILKLNDTASHVEELVIEYGNEYQVTRLVINWDSRLQVIINIKDQIISLSYRRHGSLKNLTFGFADLSSSIQEIGFALREANYS